jgi:drug/metabolite transporter (DMT)-like permease
MLFAFLAMFMGALNDALIKSLGGAIPANEVAFFRFCFGFLSLLPLVYSQFGSLKKAMTTKLLGWQIARAGCSFVATLIFFWCLQHLKLGDALALFQIAPLVMALTAVALGRDHLSLKQWVFMLLGFVGVVLICQPEFALHSGSILPVLAILFAATISAWGNLIVQHITHTETPLTVMLWMYGLCLSASIISLPANFVMPSGSQFYILISGAIVSVASQYALTVALSHVPINRLAPVKYTSLLWALLMGFLFFAEVPSRLMLAGAALIILGCWGCQHFSAQRAAKASV